MSHPILTSSSRRKQLTRDQCVEIRVLRRTTNFTFQQIAERLGLSWCQVQRACARKDENPLPRSGRPPVLSTEQVDELEAYIQYSHTAQQMSYLELSIGPFMHWNCGEIAIRGALERRGYRRCLVRARVQPGKRGKVLRWETRKKNDKGKRKDMTETDTERTCKDRGEDLARGRNMMIGNGEVNGDSDTSEEVGGIRGRSEDSEQGDETIRNGELNGIRERNEYNEQGNETILNQET